MGNHIGVPTTADLEAMMATTNFTDVELRRLFGQLNVLTESAVTALGGPLNKMPAVPSEADGEGTDQRLVLKRIAQLLDPCKSEEDRFTKFVATLAILTSKDEKEGKLRFAFNVFDFDGDGFISNADLQNL